MFTFAPLGPIDMLGPLLLQLIRTPGRIFVLLRQYKPIIFANLLANLMKICPKHKDLPQHILGCLTKNMYEAWCFAVKTLILLLIYIKLMANYDNIEQ